MKKKLVYSSHIKDDVFPNQFYSGELDLFAHEPDNLETLAKHYGVSKELVNDIAVAIHDSVEEIKDAVHKDLVELYEEIEFLRIRIEKQ